MIFELAKDFHDAVAAMPKEHPKHRILELFEEAVRRDIHFIARHPTTFFQCMWNTCWWQDSPEAASFYEMADSRQALDGARPDKTGGDIHHLLEQWRSIKTQRDGEFMWCQALVPPFVPLGSGQEILQPQEGKALAAKPFGDKPKIVSLERTGDYDCADGTIFLWDMETREATKIKAIAEFMPDSLAIAADRMQLAVGGRIWRRRKNAGANLGNREGNKEEFCVQVYDFVTCNIVHEYFISVASPYRSDGTGMPKCWGRLEYRRASELLICYLSDVFLAWQTNTTLLLLSLSSAAGWHNVPFLVNHENKAVAWACRKAPFDKPWRRLKIEDCAMSPDGKRVAVVTVTHVAEGRECMFYGYGGYDLFLFARVSDSYHIVSQICLDDDPRSGQCVSVDFSPTGSHVIVCMQSGNYTQSARLLLLECEPLHIARAYTLPGTMFDPQARFCSDGQRIAVSGSNLLILVDLKNPPDQCPLMPCFIGHSGEITDLNWTIDARHLVTAADDGTIRVWDTDLMTPVKRPLFDKGTPRCAAFARDGRSIAIGCADYHVRVWDIQTCRLLHELENFRYITDVEFCEDGRRIWSMCGGSPGVPIDHVTYLWDATTGEELLNDWPDKNGKWTNIQRPEPIANCGGNALKSHGGETAVIEEKSGLPVAWLPVSEPSCIVASPERNLWATISGDHLHIVKLAQG